MTGYLEFYCAVEWLFTFIFLQSCVLKLFCVCIHEKVIEKILRFSVLRVVFDGKSEFLKFILKFFFSLNVSYKV